MQTFLLEIGSEEIPAGYINPALKQLEEMLTARLNSSRIAFSRVRTMGTPRRLTIIIDELAFTQEACITEAMGPPTKIALNDKGEFTQAALKFAEKVGVTPADLRIVVTDKGEYIAAQVEEEALDTIDFLARELPDIIQKLSFPKKMHWGDGRIEFARPLQSIVALFGSEIVPFSLEKLTAGRKTFGHRFLANDPINLNHALDYEQALEDAFVIVDIEKRRQMLIDGVEEVVKMTGGEVLQDEALIDLVVNLVENPFPAVGSFDNNFLEIPEEVLITSMREHQKYFSIIDKTDGKLMPYFVLVSNMKPSDMTVVVKGNERVLHARLEDARFFFDADRQVPLALRVDKLKNVLFQAKLGSMYNKMERVQSLAKWLCTTVGYGKEAQTNLERAAYLYKADLVTGMVGEFPELQGIMGRVYALNDGENIAVAQAIEEHYMPIYSGGPLPQSKIGALLAIAEKMDTICGCFSVGLIPTGAADPYALRRQAIGILQIMRKFNLSIALDDIVMQGLANFNADKDVATKVMAFFQTRFERILEEDGFAKDIVAAVLATNFNDINDAELRVKALDEFKSKVYFEALAAAFKRVVNILHKAEIKSILNINEQLFEEAEQVLWNAVLQAKAESDGHLNNAKYDDALVAIAGIRNAVDSFFNDVMVMAEDEKLRNNRLALLSQVGGLFRNFADFSKISTQ